MTVGAPPVLGEPVRIEAEDFTSSDLYATQSISAASGDEAIFLPGNGASGSATYDLAAKGVAPGTYNVEIAYFDENDGESTVSLSIDGVEFGAFTMDEATSSSVASSKSLRTKTFFDVTVGATGQLVIEATTDAGEFARVDYIELTPVEDAGGPDNTAPFAPFDLPDASRVQNAAFDFDAGALFADTEEDALAFSATATTADGVVAGGLPAGVTFDPVTGVFGGAPSAPGSYVITVIASDGEFDSAPEAFTLTVRETNDAPALETAIDDQTVRAGDPVALSVAGAFSDPDGDALTYSVEGDLPPGVTFDTETGAFGGTLEASAPARSYQVTVTATDAGGSNTGVSDTFLFNVIGSGVDTRPTVRIEAESGTLVDGFFVEQGSRIRLLAEDGGTATYDLSGIAQGDYLVRVAYFDENDGESTLDVTVSSDAGTPFSGGFTLDEATTSSVASQSRNFREKTLDGTLTLGANGLLTLTGQADAGEFLRVDWIELIPVGGGGAGNFAPSEAGDGIPDATVQGLGAISLDATAAFADPEEDALTYALVSGPDWISVDPATGAITGTPPAGGVYAVTVSAEDAANNPGILATSDFTLTVEDAGNATPTLEAEIADQTVAQGGAVNLDVTTAFSDPDGDALTYSVAGDLPPGVTFADGVFGGAPDATASGAYEVTVTATDAAGSNTGVSDTFLFTVTGPDNAAPTAVTLTPVVASLAETADTAAAIAGRHDRGDRRRTRRERSQPLGR